MVNIRAQVSCWILTIYRAHKSRSRAAKIPGFQFHNRAKESIVPEGEENPRCETSGI